MQANNWENNYSVLTQEDRDNPIKALQDICTRDSLFNQRNNLFEVFQAATDSLAWEGDTRSAKSDSLYFYSTTLHLWEIACRTIEMISQNRLLFSYVEQDQATAKQEQVETKNYSKDGDAVLTKEAEEAFLSFVTQVKPRELNIEFRNLMVYYFENEPDREEWADRLLYNGSRLFEFLDVLEDEYGPE